MKEILQYLLLPAENVNDDIMLSIGGGGTDVDELEMRLFQISDFDSPISIKK